MEDDQTSLCAFIDDRSIVTKSPGALTQAWERSNQWDKEHGWQVNYKKTAYICVGSPADLWGDSSGIRPTDATCLLGYDVVCARHARAERQQKRIEEVRKTA